jgi:hypothetical protein
MPLVVQIGQDRTDEPDDGGVVGEDAHDPGPAFDLVTRSKGLVLQISPMAAHLTQPRRSPPKPTTRRDAHLPKTSTHDRTPRDAYLAGR